MSKIYSYLKSLTPTYIVLLTLACGFQLPMEARPRNPAILSLSILEDPVESSSSSQTIYLDGILIQKDNPPFGYRTRISKKRLQKLIRSLQNQITTLQPLSIEDPQSPSRALFQLFLAPAKPSLDNNGITDLVISLDRGLHSLPVAALHSGKQYFGLEYSFSITPALSLTSLSPSDLTNKKLLAAGVSTFPNLSDLPLVPLEIRSIASTPNSGTYLEKNFTPSVLTRTIQDDAYGRVHVATHADFLPGGPDSALIYTGTIPLSFSKLREARLSDSQTTPLDLFVLSACRTAIGDEDSELGFAGLALQSGASSAIGTLWYVDDLATSVFFIQLYKLLNTNIIKGEAVRQVRHAFATGQINVEGNSIYGLQSSPLLANLDPITLLQARSSFTHPYFWSGITLLGSPW